MLCHSGLFMYMYVTCKAFEFVTWTFKILNRGGIFYFYFFYLFLFFWSLEPYESIKWEKGAV